MSKFWQRTDAPEEYDARWKALADKGHNIHGEADLVETLLRDSGGTRVLDAGCGTGRVAIELAQRGFDVVGVEIEASMLAVARGKTPDIEWIEADLTHLELDAEFDLVLLAGNVMIFVDPGTEASVVRGLASHLAPGGLLVSGFSILPDRLSLKEYDQFAETAGLGHVTTWSTWDREPLRQGNYAVSVHQRPHLFGRD
ncbi:class I SAM-dependent methyltransferase [soil metagenome]